MKGLILFLCLVVSGLAEAQLKRATLQVSGLTCALCAKTVQKALEKLSFVKEVKPDLNTQEYTLTFRTDKQISLEEIKGEVEDAGFSVARLQLVAAFETLPGEAQLPIKMGTLNFLFYNAANLQVKGDRTFTLVEKDFLSGKALSKYCKEGGANCGNRSVSTSGARIYKAIFS